ncbi:MAG: hypothetical protein V7607_192 [Solirubrobacteraceae bacterium]
MDEVKAEELGYAARTVQCDGFEIRYWGRGAGTPLIVLHGGGGPDLGPAHDAIAETVHLVYFELPGFGDSEVNDSTESLPALAETMANAVAALGFDRYALLGTSFGGAAAAWLAVMYPERVCRLILEAPAAFRPQGARLPSDLEPQELMRALYAHPERRRPTPAPDPAVMAKQMTLVRRLLDGGDEAALEERLRGLPVPTLVIFGLSDGLIPPEMGRRYKALIPNCDYVLVYDAAHEVNSDRPEAFARLVADFVEHGEAHVVSRASSLITP